MSQESVNTTYFPPVVAVLGHVDHGKTTLLDAIRRTSIAERELGGITQRIGASSVEIISEGKRRKITFIDTPGHEAFAKMRSRGAQVADIGLLVVSAADGVMPQTRESISVLKEAGIPYIVVLTKSDLPTANPQKVKQQLLGENVLLEEFGGDIPSISVSAKTNYNIKELLDLILLVYEMHYPPSKDAASAPLKAVVIESRLDPKAGPKATVIIKKGTIRLRDELYTEHGPFRVRSIFSDRGELLQEASVGDAVEILGFTRVPSVGSLITKTPQALAEVPQKVPLKKEFAFPTQKQEGELHIILVADSQGSLEAITNALPEKVKVIYQKTGEITEADVLMAKSTGSLIIGFNTRIRPDVAKLARTEKVLMKNYSIIYELLDEISEVLAGKELEMMEQIFGTAQILAKFPYEKTYALGIRVLDGRVAKGDKARLVRGEEIIGETQITSLRIGKNPVSKVEKGQEAGILISPLLDFQVGDMIICHE